MNLADFADLLIEPEWMKHAACRDMDSNIFFPSRQGPSDRRARQICAGCAVQADCLDYALSFSAHYDYGIYAGTNQRERRKLRKQRRAAA